MIQIIHAGIIKKLTENTSPQETDKNQLQA